MHDQKAQFLRPYRGGRLATRPAYNGGDGEYENMRARCKLLSPSFFLNTMFFFSELFTRHVQERRRTTARTETLFEKTSDWKPSSSCAFITRGRKRGSLRLNFFISTVGITRTQSRSRTAYILPTHTKLIEHKSPEEERQRERECGAFVSINLTLSRLHVTLLQAPKCPA